ncbi:hypothetical protein ACFO4N_03285 [Camelliibacillus cellulosilyticus]|uniref:Uncharacterized protein n=1 Tax=Camelliibacillus cellulosilyticus TaxID=2174486 RepID=A0ABV9GID3_9BACL
MGSGSIMGLPGAIYAMGLSNAWIAIGLTISAYVNDLVLAPQLK